MKIDGRIDWALLLITGVMVRKRAEIRERVDNRGRHRRDRDIYVAIATYVGLATRTRKLDWIYTSRDTTGVGIRTMCMCLDFLQKSRLERLGGPQEWLLLRGTTVKRYLVGFYVYHRSY